MLMAALQARSEGAFSLFWRFSLPDEMAREGRENLMNLLRSLAEQVYLESGFPVPENVPPVSFASVIPQEKAAPRDYPAFSAASRSADDLIRLQYDLLRMIVLTPDCKEVLLPAGVWTVGEDIPAGTWSLRAGNTGCSVRYYKDTVTYNRNVYLLAPKSSPVTLDLKEGWQLYLYRPVYFAPVRPGE